ncbi:MAG: milk-clotting protease [Ferruginibacter sp.]|uniref:M57 family metalloprotease n=1 Tax=Ferruginibacter sp. TaxID=1940288 RepID=UPI00265A595E|nr:M57 family metalloprotease [Ferruginibacter sp.]MDB5277830.1 milk-clotting protease [Ferruginibacter sp.]
MKKVLLHLMLVSAITFSVSSCKKTATTDVPATDEISAETKAKIAQLGFGTSDVKKTEDGYLVEGDINLTDELLNSTPSQMLVRVGNAEQYRTTNLITPAAGRVYTILVSNLTSAFEQGTDLAIARYNALGLKFTFQRITSGTPDITVLGFNQRPRGGYITLGSSGFPTSTGAPYNTIKMNTNAQAYGTNPDVKYVGSVLQHELGHCIGMRHTDYYDRSISCGGATSNEGASTVGAILIPGTPSTATLAAASWMLACSNGGDRTFNSADVTGLNYLYK